MNRTSYQVEVTELIDAAMGPDFEYPASFEADVDNCFGRHLSAADAAEELASDYSAEIESDYAADAAHIEKVRDEQAVQEIITRLTAQLGEWADNPSNVNGAVVAYDEETGKWRLYDSNEDQEFDSVEELETAVADYVAAMERA